MNESEAYNKENGRIVTAGIKESPYIRTDYNGEKHQHKSVYFTHVEGEYFPYYTTASSKLRKKFLRILLEPRPGDNHAMRHNFLRTYIISTEWAY